MSMKIRGEFVAVAALASLMVGAAGCGNNSTASNEGSATPDATATMGAAEKAGKAMDVAGQNVKDSTKEAVAKTDQAMDKAGQDVKKEAHAAGEEIGGAAAKVSDATQDAAAAAVLTPKVKNALAMSTDINATTINVDTLSDKKTVVLRGSVPSADKKALAQKIAEKELADAKSTYTVTNQLTVGGAK